MPSLWRAELHCHSEYSRDCRVGLKAIIKACQQRRIDCLALTDHNEVAGAQRLAEIAPGWLTIIVGEEIATQQGDLIGLFLTDKIPARLPIEQSIAAIQDQGGCVLLPHPTDRVRREAVGAQVAEAVADQLDFIETFNARTLISADNRSAAKLARAHSVSPFVGSDAHTLREYGQALNLMAPFSDQDGFVRSLRGATFATSTSSLLVHAETALVKRLKRHLTPST